MNLSIRKISGIYFLAISIPATLAGLFGMYIFLDFLRMAQNDAPGADKINVTFVVFWGLFLTVIWGIGLCNLPGYFRLVFRFNSEPRFFWRQSANYNLALFIVDSAFLFAMGGPPELSFLNLIGLGLLLISPLIGLSLSLVCLFSKESI